MTSPLSPGSILRTSQAIKAGIHPETLYTMRDSGELEVISRGVFRLSDIPPLGNSDLVTVATRISQGLICLIYALSFYELTTQIPHEVHVALPRGADFKGEILIEAIEKTFKKRKTPITGEPTIFNPSFMKDATKQSQWQGFIKKTKLNDELAHLRM